MNAVVRVVVGCNTQGVKYSHSIIHAGGVRWLMCTRTGSLAIARTVITPDRTMLGDQVVPDAKFSANPLHVTRGLSHLWSCIESRGCAITHQPTIFEMELDENCFLVITTQVLWNAVRPWEIVATVRGQPESWWVALQGAVEQHARLQQPLTYKYMAAMVVQYPAASR